MSTSTLVAVHVTPRSGRDEVVGVRNDAQGAPEVSLRVTAPPDGGKANAAVCKLVAKQLGVSKSSVSVKRGETSRHKLLDVALSRDAVEAWMASMSLLE